jgi:hypothetical protein
MSPIMINCNTMRQWFRVILDITCRRKWQRFSRDNISSNKCKVTRESISLKYRTLIKTCYSRIKLTKCAANANVDLNSDRVNIILATLEDGLNWSNVARNILQLKLWSTQRAWSDIIWLRQVDMQYVRNTLHQNRV